MSPGCTNCYAEAMSGRNSKTLGVWGPKGTRVVAVEAQWKLPLKWNRDAERDYADWQRAVFDCRSEYDSVEPYQRPRVFCASLADVFEDWQGPMKLPHKDAYDTDACICHECGKWMSYASQECTPGCKSQRVPRKLTMDDVRLRLFRLIDQTPHLDWLILTKRPQNIARMMPRPKFDHDGWNGTLAGYWHQTNKTRPNLWLGVSVENQAAAEERHPALAAMPAAVTFWSAEPLLGPIDAIDLWNRHGKPSWVIVGGEIGPGHRDCDPAWIADIVRQCEGAGVPCFVKQASGPRPGMQGRIPLEVWQHKEFPT